MFFLGNREIDVQEYTRNSIVTPNAQGQTLGQIGQLPFNGWRMAQAVAMTTASQFITRREYWFDVVSSLLGLSNTIHSHQLNIRVKSSRMSRLRDFSRTNRIGEMSQGITYLELQRTGYPFVVDFHTYCDTNNIPIQGNPSTPDFVGQDAQRSNNICLAESKGKLSNSRGSIKTKLSNALDQCDSGETILNNVGVNVHKKLGFCTEWSNENDQQNSMLHFVDPKVDFGLQANSGNNMFLHFAAWMYIVGDFQNVNNLIKEGGIDWRATNFSLEEIEGRKYWILTRFPYPLQDLLRKTSIIYERLIDYPQLMFRIGISDEVVKLLEGRSDQSFFDLDFTNRTTENYSFFNDGTFIDMIR